MHEAPAFPGGFVFVPAALILAAQSEDEFAGMLAHAIAHIEARHGTKQAAGAQTLNLATVPLIFIGGWMGNATPNGNRLAIPRAFLPVWRANELAADSLAAKMMSAAGYDPEALARYIEREQPESEERAQGLAAIRAVPAQRPASPHPDFRAVQEEIRRVSASITAERPPRLSK